MAFFDIMSNILVKRNQNLQNEIGFDSNWSPYMAIRYLRMEPHLIDFATIAQSFLNAEIEPRAIYEWLYINVPKQKSGFIKYIKPKTSKK